MCNESSKWKSVDESIGNYCLFVYLPHYFYIDLHWVYHSMSVNTPTQPWVAFNAAGIVIAGHCNCTAGYVILKCNRLQLRVMLCLI